MRRKHFAKSRSPHEDSGNSCKNCKHSRYVEHPNMGIYVLDCRKHFFPHPNHCCNDYERNSYICKDSSTNEYHGSARNIDFVLDEVEN